MFISDQHYSNWQTKLEEKIFFRRFWVFFSNYSILLVFVLGIYLAIIGQTKIVLLALAAFVLGRLIISPSIFLAYKKQRPYQKLNFKPITSRLFSLITAMPTSFPSDHSVSFAAVSTVLIWYFPYWAILLIPLTLLNGWGRVILGYHYVNDVLAGWAIGILSGFLMVYFLAPLVFTRW